MKVYEIHDSFGLDHLVQAERPDPRPGPGEALVRVSAASLNYRDLMMIQGLYNPRQPLPLIPCSDGAGVVTEVGEGVTRVRPGDRVVGAFFPYWISGAPRRELLRLSLGGPLDGMLSEQIVLPAEGLVHTPEWMSDVEAATLPCAGLTAWMSLIEDGGLKPGQTVLLQGTGGVSLFALQIAKVLGARVIQTSSSDEKLERAKALGADHGINYRETPDWGKAARELTGGTGVDLVVEVGGAGTLRQSLAAVKFGGRICLLGVLAGNRSDVELTRIFMSRIRVQGVLVGNRDGLEGLVEALGTGAVRPIVDRVFPFGEVREALEHMAQGRHFGKIGITVQDG